MGKRVESYPPFLPLGLRIYFDDLNSFCDTYFPRTMSLWLLVTGLLMVAAPLTFIYVKKIREARRLQVLRLSIIGDDSVTHDSPQALSNRLASYAHSAAVANTDKQNFVAENVEKNEDGILSS